MQDNANSLGSKTSAPSSCHRRPGYLGMLALTGAFMVALAASAGGLAGQIDQSPGSDSLALDGLEYNPQARRALAVDFGSMTIVVHPGDLSAL